ncbi:dienelactone hydrolase family protein [Telmatospirillum siberiense]|uniref:Carboxymethylenebutenolidase n=1 Tax=Telmatospirillum siberiense TaxID=382514 RepID=A0A2N3PX50_9PROT|nr:dienelactone hydrolase family protein [Telmatospirillum siberiense]PKU24982.1 carboxymethylenebutenolidase [Telmatospirillum siberiense]
MGSIPFDHRRAWLTADATSDLSRRGFMVTSLAVGFAAAAQPVMAQAVTTNGEGLIAGEVAVPVAGGVMPAYQAYPATGSGPFPTVIVVQEIFGVHEYIKDVCRRLAKLGYYAVTGELYARQGDVSKLTDIKEIFAKVVSKVPDEQVISDIDSLVDFARSSGKADITRLGITGFCWGGRATWLYAAHNSKVRAAVAWYGMVDPPMWNEKAISVFQLLPKLKVPVLGLYGAKDTSIPVAHVETLKAELAGTSSEIVIYPDVGHAFHADYRPSYDRNAAEDGWHRLQDWFKKFGVA